MVYNWEVLTNENEILTRLVDKNFSIYNDVILEKIPNRKRANKISDYKVELIKYDELSNLRKVTTAEDGLLFTSDTWFPGWRAFLDGKEVNLLRANYAFRAIEVPKGDHLVEFVYKPLSFYNGLKVSISALLVLVVLFLFKANDRYINHYR